ncbi:hypothetical protein P0Y35_01830 [Kiritimatiellaeota bacterium B1221]|nr:hypothetical protein [Kiritimatiellaeota bacterium B1221]
MSNRLKLMGIDSRDGKGVRELLPDISNYCRPVFTPDGKSLLVNNRKEDQIYLYNWSNGNYVPLAPGYVLDAVKDPASDAVWIYAARGNRKESRVRYNSVVRFPLNNPDQEELIWDKTPISPDSFLVSADLKMACGQFPWPKCGVVDLVTQTASVFANGCWTALSPDNSKLFWVFDRPHRNVYLQFPGESARRKVDIHEGKGIDGFEVYHPRWSNDVRIISTTGPYKVGGGGNKIHGGGPEVEIYVGRFDAHWGHIENWVKVTDNDRADFYPEVWVKDGEHQNIHKVLAADPASPLRIDSDTGVIAQAPPSQRTLSDEWPGTSDYLSLLWQPDVSGSYKFFIRRGQAEIGEDQIRILKGAVLAHDKTNELLLSHFQASNELTLECVIETASLTQTGPARIVSFSNDSQNRNFTLGQEGAKLIFRLRTPQTGNNGIQPESHIGNIAREEQTHILITYQNGNLRAYINGEESHNSQKVKGDFSNWQPAHFILGDEWKDPRNWQGNLSHLALYNLAITAEEAAARYALILEAGPSPK